MRPLAGGSAGARRRRLTCRSRPARRTIRPGAPAGAASRPASASRSAISRRRRWRNAAASPVAGGRREAVVGALDGAERGVERGGLGQRRHARVAVGRRPAARAAAACAPGWRAKRSCARAAARSWPSLVDRAARPRSCRGAGAPGSASAAAAAAGGRRRAARVVRAAGGGRVAGGRGEQRARPRRPRRTAPASAARAAGAVEAGSPRAVRRPRAAGSPRWLAARTWGLRRAPRRRRGGERGQREAAVAERPLRGAHQAGRRLLALLGALVERGLQDPVQRVRQAGRRGDPRRRLGPVRVEDERGHVIGERRRAGQALDEHAGQGVHVARGRPRAARGDLGRDVVGDRDEVRAVAAGDPVVVQQRLRRRAPARGRSARASAAARGGSSAVSVSSAPATRLRTRSASLRSSGPSARRSASVGPARTGRAIQTSGAAPWPASAASVTVAIGQRQREVARPARRGPQRLQPRGQRGGAGARRRSPARRRAPRPWAADERPAAAPRQLALDREVHGHRHHAPSSKNVVVWGLAAGLGRGRWPCGAALAPGRRPGRSS